MGAPKAKAIFLDRDGTINEDPGYLGHEDQLVLIEGAREALARLKSAGFLLVVISNQSGVGRGLIREDALPAIHERLNAMLGPDAKIDRFELCVHRPEDDCACRKPKPKLILDAARALDVDVSRSYTVGDRASDVRAGRAAGCRASVLVLTGQGRAEEAVLKAGEAACAVSALPRAADWILRQESEGS